MPISAYGPWILPAHVRLKQQLAEQRMNHKATPLEAHRRRNVETDQNRNWSRVEGQTHFVDGLQFINELNMTNHRGNVSLLVRKPDTKIKGGAEQIGESSRFATLERLSNEDVETDSDRIIQIETMKQHLRDIPNPLTMEN